MSTSKSMDEFIATFERELPNWYWSICECWISIHGHCGPDGPTVTRENPDWGMNPIELEIDKPRGPRGGGADITPAQFLIALLAKAKIARAKHHSKTPAERDTTPAYNSPKGIEVIQEMLKEGFDEDQIARLFDSKLHLCSATIFEFDLATLLDPLRSA